MFKPLLGLAALLAIAAADGSPARLGVLIGIVEADGKGEVTSFTPSPEIPNVPGTIYGWDLAIEDKSPMVKLMLTREITMPAPTDWGPPEATVEISPDRRIWRKTSEVTFEHGRFFEAMEISPGDPSGLVMVRFAVNGKNTPPFAIRFMPQGGAKQK
ncbi:MAG: hypothetical protein K1X51_18540 [Rhodospirillaceae bacterium]|nr:hypothetical protein [Rhodospirillaceae bacterium]